MPIDLYVGPRRKRPWRIILLVGLIITLGGLLAWQQGWRPNQTLANLGREALQNAPLPLADLPLPAELTGGPVIVGNSEVVQSPQSQAYTLDLYATSPLTPTIPWPNVAGRTRVLTYTVEEGDTLWSIAYQFELDLDTLRWSNPDLEQNPDLVGVGDVLFILPVQGVYHFVAEGDTLESIAALYGVNPADILNYPPNGLYPADKLKTGQGLIVPFGRKDGAAPPPAETQAQ